MPEPTGIAEYYAARAHEYERVYEKPERQNDLVQLRMLVQAFGTNRRVLEIACGTGYWTAVLAVSAQSVVATDVGDEVIAIARARALPASLVTFDRADAFSLADLPGQFDAGFTAFWWSHLRLEDLRRFLAVLHRQLECGAAVMIVDNRYVEGSSTPIARTDSMGNTYQQRSLNNGTTFEVLKNFPTPSAVTEEIAGAGGVAIEVIELPYYWYATYRLHGDRSAERAIGPRQ